MNLFQWFWRALRSLLLALAAVLLFLEEWGWRPLAAWVARLTRWPPLAALEARVRQASPRASLAVFLLPSLLLVPVKLAALWFIHRGLGVLGVAVIVAAKLLGTALVGRLFQLTEPRLMHFAWFASALGWWRSTKAKVRAALAQSTGWRAIRRGLRLMRARLRRPRGRD